MTAVFSMPVDHMHSHVDAKIIKAGNQEAAQTKHIS